MQISRIKLGFKSSSLIESWNCEVVHSKDYIFPKESYLSNLSLNGQLLGLLANLMLQTYPLIALEILLSDNECTSHRMNQSLLHLPCPNLSHVFVVLEYFLNFVDDYDAYKNFNQLQENGLSCLARKELGSII